MQCKVQCKRVQSLCKARYNVTENTVQSFAKQGTMYNMRRKQLGVEIFKYNLEFFGVDLKLPPKKVGSGPT